jgi:hypothetical protein
MISTRSLTVLASTMLLLSGTGAQAQSKQLMVTSASVDRAHDTVTLKGSGFGVKRPYVWAEMTQMTVLSGTDEELVVSFPASVLDGTFLFTVARGNSANERATFYVTTSRPQVLEGKEGPAGPQGAAGPAGPQGPKGDKGDKGDTGAQGLQGPQGVQGAKGEKGDLGPQGLKGDTGATGATGAAGAQGAEGPQGPQGVAGPQGPAGPQGAAGAAGPQGAQGPAGLTGPAGLQGPAGSNGVSGYERVIGDSGALPLGAGISSYVIAPCPAGKKAIAGGHELTSISAQGLNVTMSAPYENGVSGWRVSFRNGTTNSMSNVQVKAHVTCAFVQ